MSVILSQTKVLSYAADTRTYSYLKRLGLMNYKGIKCLLL